MTTTHYIVIAHLMVNCYVFGKDSSGFNSDDSFLTKLLTFLIDIVFGLEILLLKWILEIKETKLYDTFVGLTQFKFYFQYFTKSGLFKRIDGDQLRYAVRIVRRCREEGGSPGLVKKHTAFTIGLLFKAHGLIYKG